MCCVGVASAAPAPDGLAGLAENLYGVAMLGDGRHVWAVGAFGSIFHSTDAGRTWVAQASSLQEPLFDVAFASRDHGIVVGKSGVILHTADGGKSWARANGVASKHLFDIAMVDERRAWAVGDWGVLLHTNDGGRTWVDHSIGDDVVLSGVSFADPEHGWVVGEFGTVLSTTDGGGTWDRQTSGTEKTLFGVAFTTPRNGWIVGMDGLVLRTADGGARWTVQRGTAVAGSLDTLGFVELVRNPALYDVAMAGVTGCIAGDTGTVLTTRDGGATWASRSLPEDVRPLWLRAASVTTAHGAILVGAKGLVVSVVGGDVVRAGVGQRHAVGPAR
jgi:photosystem II stability/assembly factor-like uncharacterized protein